MARASSSSFDSSQIRHIVGDFVTQLSALIEQDAVSRARQTILSAFAGGEATNLTVNGKRRGRPPGRRSAVLALAGTVGVGRKRRKAPIQLCPVPGCSNRAAPVFGMVCAKHKDLPKSEIRKFREARRAQRDKTKGRGSAAKAKAGSKAVATKGSRTKGTTKGTTKGRTKARTKATRKAKPARRQVRRVRQVRIVPNKVALMAAPRPVVPVAPKPPVVTA